MIHAAHFESLIVIPTLAVLSKFDSRLNTPEAVVLLMGTAAQESDLGFWLRQTPTGPGKGPWSIEDNTHNDVWRYLRRESKLKLRQQVLSLAREKTGQPPHSELINNPLYSCAIARIKYWMIPEPIPTQLEDLAEYWKRYFNTASGAGTAAQFIDSYNKFVLPNET